LLGKVLVHDSPAGRASGVIVETEAYIGQADPACHAAVGLTARNAPLFGKPGVAYVYLNYGLHYLVNAVTEGDGCPAAVLLRALAPLEGIDLMWQRRGLPGSSPTATALPALCRGPGNLTRALGISLCENRLDLTDSRLVIEDRHLTVGPVAWSPRIGIRVGTGQWWRAFVRDHPAVSGPRSYHREGLGQPRSVPWSAEAAIGAIAGRRGRRLASGS
jgi:DNA-3-methyladenine glycosylase